MNTQRQCLFYCNGLLLAVLLASCEKGVSPLSPRDDYYPMGKDSRWEYTTQNGSPYTRLALGDTILDDTRYAMLGTESGMPVQLIRYENGRYYRRDNLYGLFGEEHIFLQDNLPVGSTWRKEDFHGQEVNTISAVDVKRTVDGQVFTHILEVKTDYYSRENGQFKLRQSQWNLYARGVGLVATVFDHQNEHIQLTDYQIK